MRTKWTVLNSFCHKKNDTYL